MSALEFRPRFRFHTPLSIEEVAGKLMQKELIPEGKALEVRRSMDHIVLDIQQDLRHYWSPHMDIGLEREESGDQTLVRCLIGPQPTVWTMFMFAYGFFGFMMFVGFTLGLAQMTLKKELWGFGLLPIAFLGMFAMYRISVEGKKRAREEMRLMKRYIDHALECDCFALSEAQNGNEMV